MEKKQLLITIPTRNHPQYIRFYLAKVLMNARKYGVDIYISDSSDDDLTKDIVENKIKQGFDNLFYRRYPVETPAEDKMKAALINTGYDYNWLCGDGIVVNLDKTMDIVLKEMQKDRDVIVFSFFKEHDFYKEFDDPIKMLPLAWNPMSLYGGVIYKGDLFTEEEWDALFEKYGENVHFTGIFEHFLNRGSLNAVEIKTDFFIPNPYKKEATWVVGGRVLETEIDIMPYNAMDLPKEFDSVKPIAKRLFAENGNTFSKKNSWKLREYDNLTLKKVWKYRKKLRDITGNSWLWFAFVALVPKKFALEIADVFSD